MQNLIQNRMIALTSALDKECRNINSDIAQLEKRNLQLRYLRDILVEATHGLSDTVLYLTMSQDSLDAMKQVERQLLKYQQPCGFLNWLSENARHWNLYLDPKDAIKAVSAYSGYVALAVKASNYEILLHHADSSDAIQKDSDKTPAKLTHFIKPSNGRG